MNGLAQHHQNKTCGGADGGCTQNYLLYGLLKTINLKPVAVLKLENGRNH